MSSILSTSITIIVNLPLHVDFKISVAFIAEFASISVNHRFISNIWIDRYELVTENACCKVNIGAIIDDIPVNWLELYLMVI